MFIDCHNRNMCSCMHEHKRDAGTDSHNELIIDNWSWYPEGQCIDN